jgi:glutamate synthase domain-containing protein 2
MFRIILIKLRPIIREYILQPYQKEVPFSYSIRELVEKRTKNDKDYFSFGSETEYYNQGSEWIVHSLYRKKNIQICNITVGGDECMKPYISSRINISAMGYKTLSSNAVKAMIKGAKIGNFAINTGEDGICKHHEDIRADTILQISNSFLSYCQLPNGDFDKNYFKVFANLDYIKMIEVKLSQGAKAGNDTLFSDFGSFEKFLNFIKMLRELSGAKPIGLKLCIGSFKEFEKLCDSMIETNIYVDYIQIDGAEGGTIASSWELLNHTGMPLLDSINFVNKILSKKGIRNKITIFASGKIVSAFDIFRVMSLGADGVCMARGILLTLGCVQARECKSGNCPAGIATNDKLKSRAIDVEMKSSAIATFHKNTICALEKQLETSGLESIKDIKSNLVFRRMSDGTIKNYSQLYN